MLIDGDFQKTLLESVSKDRNVTPHASARRGCRRSSTNALIVDGFPSLRGPWVFPSSWWVDSMPRPQGLSDSACYCWSACSIAYRLKICFNEFDSGMRSYYRTTFIELSVLRWRSNTNLPQYSANLRIPWVSQSPNTNSTQLRVVAKYSGGLQELIASTKSESDFFRNFRDRW